MQINRRKTRTIKIGRVSIGASNPVAIQSMVKVKTTDIEAVTRQIQELEAVGCEIVRLAIKDNADARALKKIRAKVKIPLVADVHFNWRLAVLAVDNGADKIRLNPGNIYKKEEIREVVAALKSARVPLRIGVNSGSVRDLNSQESRMADKLVASALNYIKIVEGFKFHDIVISLKASNVLDTIEAYSKISKVSSYPLHLGVTATGLPQQGAIKSSIAIGTLLIKGIGDTIRVSLTDNPQEEVRVAKYILEGLGLRKFGPQITSCPTCGRCEVDLVKIVKELENKLSTMNHKLSTRPMKLAVMGCIVNGPGEAKDADVGIAFGKGRGILFKEGKAVKTIFSKECVDILLKELNK